MKNNISSILKNYNDNIHCEITRNIDWDNGEDYLYVLKEIYQTMKRLIDRTSLDKSNFLKKFKKDLFKWVSFEYIKPMLYQKRIHSYIHKKKYSTTESVVALIDKNDKIIINRCFSDNKDQKLLGKIIFHDTEKIRNNLYKEEVRLYDFRVIGNIAAIKTNSNEFVSDEVIDCTDGEYKISIIKNNIKYGLMGIKLNPDVSKKIEISIVEIGFNAEILRDIKFDKYNNIDSPDKKIILTRYVKPIEINIFNQNKIKI
jgi:hypothetical protein